MQVLLSAILPIALVALTGVIVGRTLRPDSQSLARLTLYVLFPALVLTSISSSSLDAQSALGIAVGVWINAALLYGLAIAAGHVLRYDPNERKSLIATTLFSNTGNMGLPFVEFALGGDALEVAIVYMISASVMVASFGPIALKGEGIRAGVRFTLKLPTLWATLCGLLLQTLAWPLPQVLDRSFSLVGAAAIPIALLTLGIQLSQTPFAFGWSELFAAGLRLVVAPAIAFATATLLGLDGLELQVFVIQAAMPVAVSSVIWVSELGGDTAYVARTIVLSTLLSLVTLPLVLGVIQSL